MLALKIDKSEIKSFMNVLLRQDAFSEFETRGVEISTFADFSINGAFDENYSSDERKEVHCLWKRLQPYVFNILKGAARPKLLKITFSLPASKLPVIHENAASCFINLVYQNGEAVCSTAVSQKSFSLDKSVDVAWDESVLAFFRKNKIPFIEEHI
ncbi:MAG: DUF5721 family protein [Clostridiales bacterium]|jgi:hypothetical protein|nr:DUF5721 family protein [Clostridiales bacterium]